MLSIIPTPIWNKEDITLRALRLLREIDTFFAEDPNTTKKLMLMHEIDYKNPGKKRYKFNSFLTDKQREHYIEVAKTQNVGLVCEAGTPGLSDPAKEFINIAGNVNTFDLLTFRFVNIAPLRFDAEIK